MTKEPIEEVRPDKLTANEAIELVLKRPGMYGLVPKAEHRSMKAERDAALAAVERVRAKHRRMDDDDEPYCQTCYQSPYGHAPWPCPTVAALDGAPEPEGQRWFAACWRDDNGTLNFLESATVVREYAEADVKRWRDQEQRETDGQPDRVVLASKISYPWLPAEGESK